MVNVAAHDLYNTGTAVYNGLYEITLTDITGVKGMIHSFSGGTSYGSNGLIAPADGDSVDFAALFGTGNHTGGYRLDRIKVRFYDIRATGTIPDIAIHRDASSAPGVKLCNLAVPDRIVESQVSWPPHTLLAPECANDTLTPNTSYWIVFSDMDHVEDEIAFADGPLLVAPYGSGWQMGLHAKRGASNTWVTGRATPRIGIWAEEINKAEGDPLAHGERKVGATLTADTGGITDADGLTDPMFQYLWVRQDGDTLSRISRETLDTYTLTDDDVGKRIQLIVTFHDDYNSLERLTGPATSLIVPAAPRILVGNYSQTRSIPRTTPNISTGFVSGAHPHGYAIDSIVFQREFYSSASSDEAEFRLYTSTSDSNARNRRPDTRIMTVSGPNRVASFNIYFNPQSRVKLEPSTTYHVVLTTTTNETIGCSLVTGGGEDSDSLPGFDILDRYYVYPDWATGFMNDRSCIIQIKGFELESSNFVQSVEFTSSPIQPDMYATGELIEVTATLNQDVTFDGPPVILLQIGDNERQMEYVTSESTQTSWVFHYTVVTDDRDDDGASIKQNALRGYADADLSHYGITNDQTSHVNAAPRVVSQRVSSSPLAQFHYGPGEKIQFTVEFSLPVTVVGNPRLEFDIATPGPENEFASYLSGSGTRELVFSYTVGTGDDDQDGILLNADSLRLDGDDSITGAYNGLDAALDHTALNKLTGHRIDQNPRAVSQEVTSDPAHGTGSDTYGAGDAITVEVVFNQAVTVTGAPRLRFSIGTGSTTNVYAAYVSGSGTDTLVFSYTVLATDTDTNGIYLYVDPLDYPDANADSIVGASNNLPAVNRIDSAGRLPDHKIDGAITN